MKFLLLLISFCLPASMAYSKQCAFKVIGSVKILENLIERNSKELDQGERPTDFFKENKRSVSDLPIGLLKNGKFEYFTSTDLFGNFSFDAKGMCFGKIKIAAKLVNEHVEIRPSGLKTKVVKLATARVLPLIVLKPMVFEYHELLKKSEKITYHSVFYFYLLQKVRKHLLKNDIKIKKAIISYPSLFTWSNFMAGTVPIGHRESLLGKYGIGTTHTVTHEFIHQWWYEHFFKINYLSYLPGKNKTSSFGTHDIIETEDVQLFEKFAMTEAEYLIQEVFKNKRRIDVFGQIDATAYSPYGIIQTMVQDKSLKINPIYKKVESLLASKNDLAFSKILVKHKHYVRSVFRMLLQPNWYDYDLTGSKLSSSQSCQDLSPIDLIKTSSASCYNQQATLNKSQIPFWCKLKYGKTLFRPFELFYEIEKWNKTITKKTPLENKGIDDFINHMIKNIKSENQIKAIRFIERSLNPALFNEINAYDELCKGFENT